MGKLMMGSCDGCGASAELGSLGSAPMDWWGVTVPFDRSRPRQALFDGPMACSPECLLVAVAALVADSVPGYAWGLTPMTTERSRVVHAVPLGLGERVGMRSLCSGVTLEQLVPASGDGLRICRKCEHVAERLEPGWFHVEPVSADGGAS